ncbi:VWA domain-containing protein [Natrarchaeobius halalkaliphilus]|uniref:VWA domain-containing protein n=1 Tax=Natrarchaeobius halalkaliphilus TaxID=1679091 RepID=A0A3N6LMX4_9EURY|nr:VWA domain-containing protein [Natrarchaeobius halalkaliphilus]RQG89257.1 VWA domain-containing protein [Natrarchaeobius halalkaliphilus]
MFADAGGKKLSSIPFPAIVGQADLKRVLLVVAANDALDGALIVGEKGTAKSTAVRALVDLLPEQRVVADCRFGCSPDDPTLQCTDCRERNAEEFPIETRPVPLVTLPLGATRDRVLGTLSIEDALAGEADFDPGLLARANRGILYVDEVNLLEDHLVDVILDAAASGVNTVERDGVSVSHPANVTLIGTMNPEEGDLRPQLRDRFALRASVEGCRDVDDRIEIIDRALERHNDRDPTTAYVDDVERLRETVADATDRLSRVVLPTEFKAEIAELCLEADVDGHRGDVATARTAVTLSALEGRTTVIQSDVRKAATYALPHRLRSAPFEDEPDLDELLEDRFDRDSSDESDGNGGSDESSADGLESERQAEPGDGDEHGGNGDECCDPNEPDERSGSRDGESKPPDETDSEPEFGTSASGRQPNADETSASVDTTDPETSDGEHDDASCREGPSDEAGEDNTARPLVPGHRRVEPGDSNAPELDIPDADGDRAGGSRASAAPSADNRGARVRSEPASGARSIDAAASVRSAAAHGRTSVEKADLRQSVRAGETRVTIVFAVDASASMRPAMREAKSVVLELLRDSYQHRDEVAFVAFAGDGADVLLPPTDSVSLAARHLKDLPSGDRTPLPAGLETTRSVIERAEPDAAVVVLVTDGRANVSSGSPTDATRDAARRLAQTDSDVLVVDAGTESRSGLSALVARETGGTRVPLSSLSVETVRSTTDAAAVDR